MVIRINASDEEHMSIYMGSSFIGSVSHDSVGWDGLSAVRSIVESIASELNLEIEYTFDEE